MKVLVTGATGFVGRALVPALLARGWSVLASGRRPDSAPVGATFLPGELEHAAVRDALVRGVDAVVHLAGRAHVMNAHGEAHHIAFRRANVEVTAALADAAISAGVRRFVFASSVKVNGEEAPASRPFREDDAPGPTDSYAQSKLEAEQELLARSGADMAITILRPPLMYGPDAKGNFRRLLHLVQAGAPLPLAAVANKRSLLYVKNFASAIACALEGPPRTRTYLVSDGEPVSTPELLTHMAHALGRPVRLFPVPGWMLAAAGSLLGRTAEIRRLTGSLVVDDSRIRAELGWVQPSTVTAALREVAQSL